MAETVQAEHPDRRIRITNGRTPLYIMESAFDTVVIDTAGNTYKQLGYQPVAEVRDGGEYPFRPRVRGAEVEGAAALRAEQVAVVGADAVQLTAAERRELRESGTIRGERVPDAAAILAASPTADPSPIGAAPSQLTPEQLDAARSTEQAEVERAQQREATAAGRERAARDKAADSSDGDDKSGK